MNNTFNLQRFFWLFNKHTKEHLKTYLMSAVVLVGILMVAMTMGGNKNHDGLVIQNQTLIFVCFLPLSGAIFTSMMFLDLGDKKKAAPLLTLPVSNFERFLVAWTYSFIIFQLVFFICFVVIAKVYLSMGVIHYANNKLLDVYSNRDGVYTGLLSYCILHSISFLGAIFFKNLHFIKTAFVFFIFVFAFILINKRMIEGFLDRDVMILLPFSTVLIYGNNDSPFMLDAESGNVIPAISVLIITVCLWAATYFKLKEKQV